MGTAETYRGASASPVGSWDDVMFVTNYRRIVSTGVDESPVAHPALI